MDSPTLSDLPTSAPPGARGAAGAASAASDFQSFLRLLTAQLRNQDPLSPLDSTQFVEQLASFSAVEQQIETNRLLGDLQGGFSEQGLEQAFKWVGQEVSAPVDRVSFSGEPLKFNVAAADQSANATFKVVNRSGEVVFEKQLAVGERTIIWDGRDASGALAAFGEYEVVVNDQSVEGRRGRVELAGLVREARLEDGALRLILTNGDSIDPATVISIATPEASDRLPGNVQN